MTISEQLAHYALGYELHSTQILEEAQTFFADTIGCILLGRSQSGQKMFYEFCLSRPHGQDASVIRGEKLNLEDAAMVNAMAAHSCDYDDMGVSINGHPSAIMVSVALAAGEYTHACGKDTLIAYIVGMECASMLGKMINGHGFNKGWNPTPTIGVIAAVCAAGRLMSLNAAQLTSAIGIACGEASGIKANHGTDVKDLTVGGAARKAVFSVQMAKAGFSASRFALEGDDGYFQVVSPQITAGEAEKIIKAHRSEFIDPGIVMKPYSTCRGNHNGIDLITKLTREHGLNRDNVNHILVELQRDAFNNEKYPIPQTPTEAKFSVAYCIAKVLMHGCVDFDDFHGDVISEREVYDIIPNVEVKLHDELFDKARFGASMTVFMKDGRSFSAKSCFAKGDPQNPLSAEEKRAKLKDCLRKSYDAQQAQKAELAIDALYNSGDVAQLMSVLNEVAGE